LGSGIRSAAPFRSNGRSTLYPDPGSGVTLHLAQRNFGMGLGGKKLGEQKADGLYPSAFLCELNRRELINLERRYE
jgi:hypothetical protein